MPVRGARRIVADCRASERRLESTALAIVAASAPRASATAPVETATATRPSILEELRAQYEATRAGAAAVAHDREGYEALNGRMRRAHAWLDKAFSYLGGVKPAIAHRYDLGHGVVFLSPRFHHGYVGQHERRVVGFPVLDEINVYYEVETAPLALEIPPVESPAVEKALDDAGIRYTWRGVEDATGKMRTCLLNVQPIIPAKIAFVADYVTGVVTVALVNVDRIDRVTLEFDSRAIDDDVLEDLLRFILGRDSAFLRRAPLAGIHGSRG